jgi:hypothetical protein
MPPDLRDDLRRVSAPGGDVTTRYGLLDSVGNVVDIVTRSGQALEAEQAWKRMVRSIVDDFFSRDAQTPVVGVRHPAYPWVAACLLANDASPKPRAWIRPEEPAPTWHHPYPEALEDVLNQLIGSLRDDDCQRGRALGDEALQRFLDARPLKYSWPFTPHIEDVRTRAERLERQGVKQKDIALAVGVSDRTLRRKGIGSRK